MSLNSKITEPEITIKGVFKDLWQMIIDDEQGRILYIYMAFMIPMSHWLLRNPLLGTTTIHHHIMLAMFQLLAVVMLLGCSVSKALVRSHEKLKESADGLIEAYGKRHAFDTQRIELLTNTLEAYRGHPTEVHADGVKIN